MGWEGWKGLAANCLFCAKMLLKSWNSRFKRRANASSTRSCRETVWESQRASYIVFSWSHSKEDAYCKEGAKSNHHGTETYKEQICQNSFGLHGQKGYIKSRTNKKFWNNFSRSWQICVCLLVRVQISQHVLYRLGSHRTHTHTWGVVFVAP